MPDIYEGIPKDLMQQNPRILKSHEPYCAQYKKVIYLFRDGRDVALSLYDFYVKLRDYHDTFRRFLSEILKGLLPYGSWQDHVDSWLFQSITSSILPVRYESLHSNPRAEIKRIGEFLGFDWRTQTIDTALAKSTLQRQGLDFYRHKKETHWEKGFKGGIHGTPGRWREMFNDDLESLFLTHAGKVSTALGYPERRA